MGWCFCGFARKTLQFIQSATGIPGDPHAYLPKWAEIGSEENPRIHLKNIAGIS